VKGTAAKNLASVQYFQRKAQDLLRTSDGRLGERGHICRPLTKDEKKRLEGTGKAPSPCPKCKRRRPADPRRVNPYRAARGGKTELAKQLRLEHDLAPRRRAA
jgi:hypothetical protein